MLETKFIENYMKTKLKNVLVLNLLKIIKLEPSFIPEINLEEGVVVAVSTILLSSLISNFFL